MSALRRRISSLQARETASWREVPTEGPAPAARLWHSLTPLGEGGRLLCLFGGVAAATGGVLDDAWLLEMPATPDQPGRWTQLRPRGRLPPGRAHHDAVVVQGRWLVVHGGLLDNGCRYHDTWRLDVTSAEPMWEQLGSDDMPRPAPRYHHSLVATRSGNLVLFGGHDFARRPLGDAWVLDPVCKYGDPAEMHWWPLLAPFQPKPRAYHAAVVAGDWMLVLGGELQDGSSDGAIWALDLHEEAWHQLQSESTGGDAGSVKEPSPLGEHGRMRHTVCCLDEDTGAVAVCGGHGRTMQDEPGPVDCTVFWLEPSTADDASRSGTSCRIRFEVGSAGPEPSADVGPFRPRRDATLLRLPSGHLALFGGNDGTEADPFGDGYHQRGCAETLVADAVGMAAGGQGEWHVASRGAPEVTAPGCAAAALAATAEVVVVDAAPGGGGLRVHALALR